MTTIAIREKLQDYIRVADDKKVKAIYSLLEEEITDTNQWWKNHDFIKELDNRYAALTSNTDKGVTMAQLENSIGKLRKKRYGK